MNTEKDILKSECRLKSMPYDTPDGYFADLKHSLKVHSNPVAEPAHTSKVMRIVPQLALAASFALLVAAGGFFLGRSSANNFSEEDYLVYSDDAMIETLYETDDLYADAITDEDIIEYLIYIGAEIDELEQY